jgi:Arc/MetJ family transcription regulator
MKISIEINDELMSKAMSLNPGLTKNAIVDKALRSYVTKEGQKKLLNLYGKIKLDDQAFL